MQVRRHHRGEGSESAALCTKEGEQQQQQRRPSGEADAARRISTLVFDSARSSCLSLSLFLRPHFDSLERRLLYLSALA